ncbi:hypothetical protein BDP81DRAFT_415278 [Colletotrichum phormii]|uniref:Uncharacterized protein n=1 Tax=Colletotrichum phormii TaxID=359342 RepID=A0AAJ0A0L1_9PEZI|nr:uncharacterized protein BDP81DRAFT_415278 [Colletotrichum phormii]KAK1654245.1 hypothetical protein BDP81DRAFT_415278 [Colletotrichum phormii]
MPCDVGSRRHGQSRTALAMLIEEQTLHGGPSIAINTRKRTTKSACSSCAYDPACCYCICKSSISGLPSR